MLISDSHLGHTPTVAIPNNTGHTSVNTVTTTVQRTVASANLLHGTHFLPNTLAATAALFPVQAIQILDGFHGTTATGLVAGNGGSGVQIETVTSTPAVFQNNTTKFNNVGYAFVCGTPVRTLPTDNVINNRTFNVSVCF